MCIVDVPFASRLLLFYFSDGTHRDDCDAIVIISMIVYTELILIFYCIYDCAFMEFLSYLHSRCMPYINE